MALNFCKRLYMYTCPGFTTCMLIHLNMYVMLACVTRCSEFQMEISRLRINKKVRVCKDCFDKAKY